MNIWQNLKRIFELSEVNPPDNQQALYNLEEAGEKINPNSDEGDNQLIQVKN